MRKIPENIKSVIVESKTGHCPLDFGDAIVLIVKHEKPQSISVDEIRRALIDTIGMRPVGCERKIYLVPDAQLMTPAAQNALLKTLEEPPEYSGIVLITDNRGSLLETIRSRCIIIMDEDDETEGADSEWADADRQIFSELFESGTEMDSVRAAEIARELISRGPDGPGGFINALRVYLLEKAALTQVPDEKGHMVRTLSALSKAEQRLKFNVNAELTLEMMLMEV